MALSSSALSSAMKSLVSYDRNNSHYKGDDLLNAIAKAVKDVFTSSAVIMVNSGGGGLYPIIGVSASALEGAINGNLSINIGGKYAKGGVISKAAAKGIATAISATTVSVPSMSAGLYPPIGFNPALVRSQMISTLSAGGIDVYAPYSRSMEVVDAVSTGVTSVVMATGLFPANGVSGGSFIMI